MRPEKKGHTELTEVTVFGKTYSLDDCMLVHSWWNEAWLTGADYLTPDGKTFHLQQRWDDYFQTILWERIFIDEVQEDGKERLVGVPQ